MRAQHAPIPNGADLVWQIANPVMAGLTGFQLAGITGAVFGAGLAAGLPLAPTALKQASPLLRNAARWFGPHLQTAWGRLLAGLPPRLVRVGGRRRS